MTTARTRSVDVTVAVRYSATEGRIYIKVPGCPLTHVTPEPAKSHTYHRSLWKHLGEYLRQQGQPAPDVPSNKVS
ncbi:MAG: hypothetical protein OXH60_10300 [Rhodospirillales bacterium]|nr:hypothetical protein [Rhodospirillales bacterium]